MFKWFPTLSCLLILLGTIIYPLLSANHQANNNIAELGMAMNYRLENVARKRVIGLPLTTSNVEGRFHREVPPLWEQFFRENKGAQIPNRINHDLLAVYTNYQGDYTKPFTYLIGYEVSALDVIPEGMIGVEIAPATYAVFTAKGEFPQSMMQTWQAIWSANIKRAYTTDFEVYPANFNPQASPEVDIYIAIE